MKNFELESGIYEPISIGNGNWLCLGGGDGCRRKFQLYGAEGTLVAAIVEDEVATAINPDALGTFLEEHPTIKKMIAFNICTNMEQDASSGVPQILDDVTLNGKSVNELGISCEGVSLPAGENEHTEYRTDADGKLVL